FQDVLQACMSSASCPIGAKGARITVLDFIRCQSVRWRTEKCSKSIFHRNPGHAAFKLVFQEIRPKKY
ncbi:hypothetical protein, partial [Mesorhizobium japonicum]|uniref:hypothetical protein n=1 Tax=Mesorhizobium japonicum TaxID=2066070 RepID=UPI003B5A7FAA